ncbi:MAG: acyl-CoA desaturase [Acetobacteraceae bacterium]
MGGSVRRADDIDYPSSAAFIAVHVACLGVFISGINLTAVLLALGLYILRIFAIGAGYHRYFSHRSFRTSRIFQFVLGFLAQTSAQRGVLWWAAHHRRHHKYSDTEQDVHSPILTSFAYAHFGWIMVPRNEPTDLDLVRDLAQYKELRWLDKHQYLPAALLALSAFLIGGLPGLVVGFCWSTVLVWHATFSINSLGHLIGRRRYVTGDYSRNNWFLALITMGEGWHNNHHAYQASVRQGFRWWEYDFTFYVLKVLSWLGLVWDLHLPPQAVVMREQRLGRKVINKVAEQIATSFPINTIAAQVQDALSRAPGWAELKSRLLTARMQAETFWNEIDLPQIPTLEEVRVYARSRLAQTASLDEIALSARRYLLELVYSRLFETAVASSGA